ncbi:hypothetical protein [Nonomuraea zeae]|uniref:Uncharacterized protein n=1 Tax=Nonomuraea zeae TaxID=1642303 RepID=A0A5S4H2T6_9ACTN|nr:hypothetical protein [Nonomuraea zeae]TMR39565.1 hypothetical protein ETD85_00705 [Nonomuraea zeae]
MEAPWSVGNGNDGQKVRRRTEVWAAAVGQQFVHPGNLQAARAVFDGNDVQEGVRLDRRSLRALLNDCEAGDKRAWVILVRQHLLAGMVNAPEKFITPGQGSEVAENRKGVRRAPRNALAALTRAFDKPDHPDVTPALLLSFARSILQAPDNVDGVLGEASGTFLAPDAQGHPQPRVLADKTWFDSLFPKLPVSPEKGSHDPAQQPDEDDNSRDEQDLEPDTYTRDQYESQHTRMTRLRADLINQVRAVQVAVDAAAEQANALKTLIEDAVNARILSGASIEPAEVQMIHAKNIKDIRKAAENLAGPLGEAAFAVMDL